MKVKSKQTKSIWGRWWSPIRKWFYPSWLIYECSYRFYDYAIAVYAYFKNHQIDIASYIGETGAQSFNTICSVATFVICSGFLTIPACFVLYKFFKIENLTSTKFEERLKRLL